MRSARVYLAAFAPDSGASSFVLAARKPGSLIPAAMVPEPILQTGVGIGFEVFINPLLFRTVFARDLPAPTAAAMAAAQHPITLAALTDKSGPPAGRRSRRGTWSRATTGRSRPRWSA